MLGNPCLLCGHDYADTKLLHSQFATHDNKPKIPVINSSKKWRVVKFSKINSKRRVVESTSAPVISGDFSPS